MTDYFVRLIELPIKVEGVTVPNSDGSFSVYINALLSEAKRGEVLRHELRHISSEHFYTEMPVEYMERQACGETLNVVVHPSPGKLAHFPSEDALASYIRRLAHQSGTNLPCL